MFLIKKLATPLALSLSLLFQYSLYEGKLPDIWKTAYIVPLCKGKGAKDEIVNNMPISLTSVICKMMESIITVKLMDHCIIYLTFNMNF